MAQFIKARTGAIINLDYVTNIFHDETGFASPSGHKKSITIRLVNNASVTVFEDDPGYQGWLDFIGLQSGVDTQVARSRAANGYYGDPVEVA